VGLNFPPDIFQSEVLMKKLQLALLPGLLLMFWLSAAQAAGNLEGPIRISSTTLGYDLQYWIYLPEKVRKPLPELYITDGQAFLGAGEMAELLDTEIENGNIAPIAAIFVDSRHPDDPEIVRRNKEFMCNADYAKFFVGELMPEISSRWTGAGPSTRRGLMGVSLGAINSACFGMMMPDVFQVLIMLSPASGVHLDVINDLYQEKPRNPSAIFISHGGPQDNDVAARKFVQTLEEKAYPIRYISKDGGHDWENWYPLLDDSLRAFAGLRAEDEIK
jgi:enterochelin esterase-like enzyme